MCHHTWDSAVWCEIFITNNLYLSNSNSQDHKLNHSTTSQKKTDSPRKSSCTWIGMSHGVHRNKPKCPHSMTHMSNNRCNVVQHLMYYGLVVDQRLQCYRRLSESWIVQHICQILGSLVVFPSWDPVYTFTGHDIFPFYWVTDLQPRTKIKQLNSVWMRS